MTQQGTEKGSQVTGDTITREIVKYDNLMTYISTGMFQYVKNDNDVKIGHCSGTLENLESTTMRFDGTLQIMDDSAGYNEAKIAHCNCTI